MNPHCDLDLEDRHLIFLLDALVQWWYTIPTVSCKSFSFSEDIVQTFTVTLTFRTVIKNVPVTFWSIHINFGSKSFSGSEDADKTRTDGQRWSSLTFVTMEYKILACELYITQTGGKHTHVKPHYLMSCNDDQKQLKVSYSGLNISILTPPYFWLLFLYTERWGYLLSLQPSNEVLNDESILPS